MNFSKQEEQILQQTVEALSQEIIELNQLQLLVVAGGVGEVIFG
jgi:hypothetical protein